MKNKYLIVLDLDGTLLPSNKRIPLLTKYYLRRINKKVCPIILASGRPARSIKKFYNILKLNTPIIALNGLHIHYPNKPSLDKRYYCDPKKIKEISEHVAKEFDINNIICETDKEIYITNDKAYLDKRFWLTNMKVKYGTLENNIKHKVMTHIIELKDASFDDNKIKNLVSSHPHYLARCWVGKFRGYIEIYQDINNKYLAIKNLCKELNINEDNVIAFGDDLNDIDMLKKLKNAYAMKNSLDNIKAISHHISEFDNEHEGVRKELKVILKNLR